MLEAPCARLEIRNAEESERLGEAVTPLALGQLNVAICYSSLGTSRDSQNNHTLFSERIISASERVRRPKTKKWRRVHLL